MGRYLDLARDVKAAGNCGKEAVSTPQWEEKARSRFLAGKGYEINEINEIRSCSVEPPSLAGPPFCDILNSLGHPIFLQPFQCPVEVRATLMAPEEV